MTTYVLYDPTDIVGALTSPLNVFKKPKVPGAPRVETPQEDAGAERKAEEKARQRARADAAARQGRRASILTPRVPGGTSSVATGRPSLLGSTRI